VFSLRYGLNSWILFRRTSGLKGIRNSIRLPCSDIVPFIALSAQSLCCNFVFYPPADCQVPSQSGMYNPILLRAGLWILKLNFMRTQIAFDANVPLNRHSHQIPKVFWKAAAKINLSVFCSSFHLWPLPAWCCHSGRGLNYVHSHTLKVASHPALRIKDALSRA
jgi:hypothetical protein